MFLRTLRSPLRIIQLIIGCLLIVLAGMVALLSDFFVGTQAFGISLKLILASGGGLLILGIHVLDAKVLNQPWAMKGFLPSRIEVIWAFLGLVLQFGLLLFVIREFKLENELFYLNLVQFTFYGFFVHASLPRTYRLPFFVLLSWIALAGVLGVTNGMWVIGIGIGFLTISHLPVSFRMRVGLLLGLGIFLAYARAGFLETLPRIVWPILSAFFMFRLIIYLYDLKHSKKTFQVWSTLAYFFLLPNVAFPFFPVLDHMTFTRTYYNDEAHRIYQTGLNWMIRGTVHLIFYRVVYYYFALAPTEVDQAYELVWFAYASFLLYLQVSGQFHLIIGMLHLFGFNLPPTNDQYLLSSNYNDLWRRVNIYWKDFMQKIFFYPAYTWFTQRGVKGTLALILTTIYVFIATWFFHAYQWFWLRGTFLFTATDIIFWVILALLVIINTLRETKTGRTRNLGTKIPELRDIVWLGVKNMATISFLTFLWTLWTSPTLGDWIRLWAMALTPLNFLVLLGCYALLMWAFIGINWVYRIILPKLFPHQKKPAPFRMLVVNSGVLLGFFLLGNAGIYNRVGEPIQTLFADLTTNRLNDTDANLLLRGYYEDLIGVNRFNSELWDVYSKRPTYWPFLHETEAAHITQDFALVALNPFVRINFHGAPFSTNRWGFRDQYYEQLPAPGTFRIAIVGPSFVMGSGTADPDVFEWVLEERLNAEFGGGKYEKYESLNFAVAGHTVLQELYVLEHTVLPFKPHALFFFSHQLEEVRLVSSLANRIQVGVENPYPWLLEIIQQAGIQPGMSQEEIEKLLQPYTAPIVALAYQDIVRLARENGITPIWVYLPTLEFPKSASTYQHLSQTAQKAGFITLDLSDVYDGYDVLSIAVAEWDLHPNEEGHRLIADGLYQALIANEEIRNVLGLEH